MKLDQAIRQAEAEPDRARRRELTEGVVNQMRFVFGWKYAKCARVAARSGVPAGRWEELLREVDDGD